MNTSTNDHSLVRDLARISDPTRDLLAEFGQRAKIQTDNYRAGRKRPGRRGNGGKRQTGHADQGGYAHLIAHQLAHLGMDVATPVEPAFQSVSKVSHQCRHDLRVPRRQPSGFF